MRRLCDRRAGLGGDGVLRVVRSAHVPDAPAVLGDDLDRCEWFMDHRNADGSHAEMCGNGIRLFLHVLVSEGLLDRAACEAGVLVGTRGGPRRVGATADGGYWVDMGPARPFGSGEAGLSGQVFPGLAVSMGNPHLACLTDVDVDALDLTRRRPRSTPRSSPTASTSSWSTCSSPARTSGCGCPSAAWGRPAPAAPAPAPPPTRRWPPRVAPRARSSSTSPAAGCRSGSSPSTTVLTGPAVIVAAGVLCPEWLAA